MKRSSEGIILGIIVLALIGGVVIWQRQSKPVVHPSPDFVIGEYPEKIVYNSTLSVGIETLQNDCSKRGGEFNACGNSCAPDAEICTDVCTYTCEFPSKNPFSEEDVSTWQNASLDFEKIRLKHPVILKTAEGADKDSLFLSHAVAYDHVDPCDFQGGAPDLKELVDFYVTFRLENFKLSDVVKAQEAESFVEDYLEGENLKISEGFIDEYSIGNLKGYQVTLGVEGCGMYKYYFPIALNMTLVIERNFITELSDSVVNEEASKLPGVILPVREKKLFEQILETVTF